MARNRHGKLFPRRFCRVVLAVAAAHPRCPRWCVCKGWSNCTLGVRGRNLGPCRKNTMEMPFRPVSESPRKGVSAAILTWLVRRLPEVPQMVRLQRVVKLHPWCPRSEPRPVPEKHHGNAIPSSVGIATERCFRGDSDLVGPTTPRGAPDGAFAKGGQTAPLVSEVGTSARAGKTPWKCHSVQCRNRHGKVFPRRF